MPLGPAKIRIGVMPGPWPEEPAAHDFLWRLGELCETTPIDSLWFSDRLIAPTLEPLTAIAAVAARTRRLKFGTAVLVLPFRSPILAAKTLATLDVLSDGRVFPAVGVGLDQRREWEAAGVPSGTRGSRTDEAIEVIRRLWLEDEVTYKGSYFTLDRVRLLPKPVQTPPPLWVGGISEAALRRAGRLSDGWLASLIAPEAFGRAVERIRAYAHAAGRAIEPDHFGTIIPFVLAPTPAAGWRAAEPYLPRARADEATLRAVTAVGPPEAVAAVIERFVACGGTKFVLRPAGLPAAMLEQLAQLAEEVIPRFHAR
ncbi:MAG: TIGR03619 family F420-dependent LLM class oxidoreductase [Candidatus Rokubacteria bacterium]|nr:TIGR03619 family F420-dependent LLM class oxidoreductase [Candidatus Rokubacteria bacterium]